MYAIIKTGGKQYRVAVGERLRVEKIPGEVGEVVRIPDVLLVGGEALQIGRPRVEKALVEAKIVEQDRAKKIKVFKKKRRKGFQTTQGHRQPYTCLEIQKIEA